MLLFPLLLTAADIGDDCFRFYYGPEKDLARARVCFEAALPQMPCTGGSSPDLPRMYLGTMYVDGQGGPVNLSGARALFTGCFQDIGVKTLLDRVAAQESGKQKANGKLDFCTDIGGATITNLQCNSVKAKGAATSLTAALEHVRAQLDAAGAALLDAGQTAWEVFRKADSAMMFDQYRGGTLAPVAEGESQNEQTGIRVKRLTDFAGYHPSHARDTDAALNAAYRKLLKMGDARHRNLVIAAERAWIVYRDAEAALYAEHFGTRFGRETVAADVKVSLTAERTKELSVLPNQ